ncbi:serine hydrolase [Novosphingobium sp. Leaf2]|uniref:serine hydrolase n=1 Tax=Novosphingobium sp. Leaf2 TaxID=1735670 RepID=UPI000700A083|nr:serine hydrolase [Novosphingobium sp. Leaf2]KQM17467.1 hypothetical protein ASE49_10485 [Novosphingobium sp. Leaf2]
MRIARILVRCCLALGIGLGVITPLHAQDDTDALLKARLTQVIAVMQGKGDPAATFDARFLHEVPPAKLRALAAQLAASGGPVQDFTDFQRAQQASATFTLRFARASAPGRIELGPTPPHLVSGFRLFDLTQDADSIAAIDADFAALPCKAGYGVYRLGEGRPILLRGRDQTAVFAIGSTFKLYVLAALTRQIRDGTRHWSDVVPVTGKSFSGGTIHTLPEGSPVTLHTLASLMIAISDNTATDILVRLVGQDALAREVKLAGHATPDRMRPILTTAQLFALKRAGPPLTARYAAADPAERERLLAALDLAPIATADPVEVFGHGPVAIDTIEWFASPADLAGAMDDLRGFASPEALAILAMNPAMDEPTARRWAFVGYKGGSEDGVMSMTWLLRTHAGTWFAVSGSWNNPAAALDEPRFAALMRRLAKVAVTP